jgi:hypothetical protein
LAATTAGIVSASTSCSIVDLWDRNLRIVRVATPQRTRRKGRDHARSVGKPRSKEQKSGGLVATVETLSSKMVWYLVDVKSRNTGRFAKINGRIADLIQTTSLMTLSVR